MPRFSNRSKRRLATCDNELQNLFYEVVKYFDCSIIIGRRGEKDQHKAFDEGKSKVRYPKGKHNSNPSTAVDVAPYPIDWDDKDRFIYFGGFVKGVALEMGVSLRWGGDWDNDTQLKDQKFNDLVHFELQ